MRGKHHPGRLLRRVQRIIPARAGQTLRIALQCRRFSDHPRACGANADSAPLTAAACGSSPRVRGKPSAAPPTDPIMRIIPARAGQTYSTLTHDSVHPDHPRACGANVPYGHAPFEHAGSSPRVRGKRRVRTAAYTTARIIPARAGQTPERNPRERSGPDHPRACGANSHELSR